MARMLVGVIVYKDYQFDFELAGDDYAGLAAHALTVISAVEAEELAKQAVTQAAQVQCQWWVSMGGMLS